MKFYTCGLEPKPLPLFEHADALFSLVCVTYKPLLSSSDHTGIRKPYWYPPQRQSVDNSLFHLLLQSPGTPASFINSFSTPKCKFALCVLWTSLGGHLLCSFLSFMSTSPLTTFSEPSSIAGVYWSVTLHAWDLQLLLQLSFKLPCVLHYSKESLCGFLVSWGRNTRDFLTNLRSVITSYWFNDFPDCFLHYKELIFVIFSFLLEQQYLFLKAPENLVVLFCSFSPGQVDIRDLLPSLPSKIHCLSDFALTQRSVLVKQLEH